MSVRNESPSETPTTLDLLAFAPHPDDAELFCGGLLAKAVDAGYRVGVIDCSRGELSSQGDLASRQAETDAASAVLGLSVRDNLGLPDGRIGFGATVEEQLLTTVLAIRRYAPSVVLAPHWECRHPDHIAASELVTRAVFFAGLRKYAAETQPHQPRQLLYYPLRFEVRPSFVCDVSAAHDKKMAAIRCYKSQVERAVDSPDAPKTLISSPLSLQSIEARDKRYGAMIGVEYGEAFVMKNALSLNDPVANFLSKAGDALLFPTV